MKPRPFTFLVTSAKVSFWISLTPVVCILATLTRLQMFTEVPDYMLEDRAMIFVLAALFLTAILTTVIAITLEVPSWIRLSLLLSTLLFSIPFLWATIFPLIGAPIMLLLSANILFYRIKSKSLNPN
jgi:phosphatidylserine synthase